MKRVFYRKNLITQIPVRFIVTVLMLTAIFNVLHPCAAAQGKSYEELKESLDYSASSSDYAAYREYPSDIPDAEYVIEAADFSKADEMEPEFHTDYFGQSGVSVLTASKGSIEWAFTVEQEGYYQIELLYCAISGVGSDIKRSLFIDDELPFKEASYLSFKQVWGQRSADISKDSSGNDIRPEMIETPVWQTVMLEDARGYVPEPFEFFFSAGEHILTLLSQSEVMLIRRIRLCNPSSPEKYTQIKEKNREKKTASGQIIPIEAEKAGARSSSVLYPFSDLSSPAVSPYIAGKEIINAIGGQNWREYGQWIEWDFFVEQEGLYNIAFYYKQSYMRGTYSARELSIDGTVPFAEMSSIVFQYNKDFKAMVLGNGQENYQFYFSEGNHTIRLKTVLGEMAEMISGAEKIVADLNEIYRSVLMVAGKSPDINRDYQLGRVMPELENSLAVQRDRLKNLLERLNEMAGKKSDKEAIVQTLIDQITAMTKDVEVIPSRLDSFKINIGGLGTWITQAVNQPLLLDRIYVYTPDIALPTQKNGFFDKLAHEVKSLFYSFIKNYEMLDSEQSENDTSITAWVGVGRDQAQTIKLLLDGEEYKDKNFSVTLMLVNMDTLLSAALAGQGPDVAMQIGNDLPMNYGMRDAVVDLSRFSDFRDVSGRFRKSAMEAFTFENKAFALPETQTFYMMFYRKDILARLNIAVPKTWDDVKRILPVLNKNYLDFGLPVSSEMSYGMFLYQNGGNFYRENGIASALDSDAAIDAFKQWTSYYTDYSFEREFDFNNRFRTGEMPIGVSDYTSYNNLQVSAPEIAGLWGIGPVPGTKKEDGSIDTTVPSTGTAAVIMKGTKNKEASWEFLKWWTDAAVQSRYGREMENLMGASARYPTANIEALKSMPWPVSDYEALSEQFENVRGIPQVPGGYFTSRNLNNAFYTVAVNAKIGAREALIDYVRLINDEIIHKRREFGLAVMEGERYEQE